MKKIVLFILQFKLKFLASHILKKFKPQIVAVTGSVAKSTTKEAIFYVLHEKYQNKIARSIGNLNTEIGTPLAILGFAKNPHGLEWISVMFKSLWRAFTLKTYPQILILEMAADKPGDIKYLTSFIKPNVAVITAIGPAHLETFKTLNNIIDEKMNLIRALPKDGTAFLNQGDEILQKEAQKISQKIIWYSGGNILSFDAARKIGEYFKLTEGQIKKGFADFEPIKSRLNLILTKRGSTIIDDTYNANPLSMKFAIDFLANKAPSRKIAILADMLELGKESQCLHYKIGQYARERVDLLIGIGEMAKNFQKSDFYYQDVDCAIKEIFSDIDFQKDDWILLKGSRRMEMEKIVDFLKEKLI